MTASDFLALARERPTAAEEHVVRLLGLPLPPPPAPLPDFLGDESWTLLMLRKIPLSHEGFTAAYICRNQNHECVRLVRAQYGGERKSTVTIGGRGIPLSVSVAAALSEARHTEQE